MRSTEYWRWALATERLRRQLHDNVDRLAKHELVPSKLLAGTLDALEKAETRWMEVGGHVD